MLNISCGGWLVLFSLQVTRPSRRWPCALRQASSTCPTTATTSSQLWQARLSETWVLFFRYILAVLATLCVLSHHLFSIQVTFTKLHPHTVLKVTWEGNLRVRSCTNCCSQWWINIDGSPCSAYENIATSISSAAAYDIFAPTTLTGVCYESADLAIGQGQHVIELDVGNCPGSRIANSATGLLSTSRLIVEEIPRRECHDVLLCRQRPMVCPTVN